MAKLQLPHLAPRVLGRAVLCLGLAWVSACGPGEKVSPVPAKDTALAASSMAGQPPLLPVDDEFERIERSSGMMPPEETDRALQALYAREPRLKATDQILVLMLRGRMAISLGKSDRLEEMIKLLEAWPEGPDKPTARLAVKVLQARHLAGRGQMRQAQKLLEDLALYSRTSTPTTLLIRAHGLLAEFSSDLGDLETAIAANQETVQLAESTGQLWRIVTEQMQLAGVLVRAQQIERAHQLVQAAKRQTATASDPLLMYSIYQTEAMVLSEMDKIEDASRVQMLALEYARKTGSNWMLSTALANVADNFLRQRQFERALLAAEEALPLARDQNSSNPGLMDQIRHNRGIALIGLKRVAEGKREVMASIAEAEATGALASQADGWQELGEHMERIGELAEAMAAYHRYRKLIEQVLREETRTALVEAQASFEDEQRRREALVLKHDNQLKAEKLLADTLQLRLWLALGGCVLLSCVLLVLIYQRIRKANLALADSNEKLKLQSERDPLTGLANRRYFQTAVQRLSNQGQLSGSVFLIDIDHFKRINDQHGHAAGDIVLVEVARRLRMVLREQDLLVRWGGEEFLIVVDTREPTDVHSLAQRLVDQIGSEPVQLSQGSIAISASVGFASFPLAPHGLAVGWERAVDLADTLMYMAKAQGRNRAYGLDSMDAADIETLDSLATRLDAAFQEGRVRMCALHGPSEPGSTTLSGAPA